MKTKIVLGCLTLALQSVPVLAHDYWLLPKPLRAQAGQKINVHLYVGEDYKPEEERGFQKDRTPFYQLFTPQEQRDLTTGLKDNQKPLTTLTLTESGSYLLVLDRNASTITLPAKKFDAYLRSEGLTDIIQQRIATQKASSPGRERYSRSVKSILQEGNQITDTPLQTLGRKIEIVPLQNPARLKAGEVFSVQVLFEGQPLNNRRVSLIHQGKSLLRQDQSTDATGKVTFTLPTAGNWMVKLVHMQACTQKCEAIDWESYWSSLTFAVP